MVLAGRGMPGTKECLICLTALLLAAAAAAMINGVLDATLDARMARLHRRVAALERIGAQRAMVAAAGMLFAASTLSVMFLPRLTTALILLAIFFYTPLYTLWFKRRSPWGVVPGGIPGALPVLVGSSAVTGAISGASLILFLVMLLWQPPHFWALALKHQDDYRRAGIPTLPLIRGEACTKACIFVFTALLLPASLALWFTGACSARFAISAACLGFFYLFSCYLYLAKKRRFQRAFQASILYLLGLLSAVIIDICVRP